MTDNLAQAVSSYWGRPRLATAIFEALQAAGKDVDALTPDNLAPFDQFHGGGKPATLALARLARTSRAHACSMLAAASVDQHVPSLWSSGVTSPCST